jgi:putative phosphoribosyl transferase
MYRDRRDAGHQLGARLAPLREDHPVVIGLPRGGVIVADEVARALDAPLDVLVARKVGAPFNPELAIGAVAPGVVHIDEVLVDSLQISPDFITRAVEREQGEVRRREAIFRGGRPSVDVRDRIVVLVEDGLATGSTAAAAIRSLRQVGPKSVILAVPVGAPETVAHLRSQVDDLVCLSTPFYFRAVGQAYGDFGQTTDAEVTSILAERR